MSTYDHLRESLGMDPGKARAKASQRKKWLKDALSSAESLSTASSSMAQQLKKGDWENLDDLGVRHAKEAIDGRLKWIKQRYDELVQASANLKSYL